MNFIKQLSYGIKSLISCPISQKLTTLINYPLEHMGSICSWSRSIYNNDYKKIQSFSFENYRPERLVVTCASLKMKKKFYRKHYKKAKRARSRACFKENHLDLLIFAWLWMFLKRIPTIFQMLFLDAEEDEDRGVI